jgi:uncharacterized protein
MTMRPFALRALGALALVVGLGWSLLAKADVPVPPLSARVIDQTGTLTSEQRASLEQTLQTFENKKGSQIAVLIVPTTAPESIEQYSIRVVEQWKLGRKKVDDGALLLIAKDDRTLRIEVGYGLEGVLSDITSKRIISDVMVPYLKKGDFYGGISAGVDRMIRVIDGEPLPAPKPQAHIDGDQFSSTLPVVLIFAVVVGGVLRSLLGRVLGASVTSGLVAVGVWLLLSTLSFALIAGLVTFFFTLVGGGRGFGGGIGGFGGFGGGSGGFGSGGFSGGGGGFGGGGASGRF